MSFSLLSRLLTSAKSIRKPALALLLVLTVFGWGYSQGKKADALLLADQATASLTHQNEALGTASERALRRIEAARARHEEVTAYAQSLEGRAPCIRDPTQP